MAQEKTKSPKLGPAEYIDFTEKDGRVTKRLMRPVLDENGGWLYWVMA